MTFRPKMSPAAPPRSARKDAVGYVASSVSTVSVSSIKNGLFLGIYRKKLGIYVTFLEFGSFLGSFLGIFGHLREVKKIFAAFLEIFRNFRESKENLLAGIYQKRKLKLLICHRLIGTSTGYPFVYKICFCTILDSCVKLSNQN